MVPRVVSGRQFGELGSAFVFVDDAAEDVTPANGPGEGRSS
jgi:hypothetical protein